MAVSCAGRYDPTMKSWFRSKRLYLVAAATGAASLSFLTWIALSGGVALQWWAIIPTITTVACFRRE
jgi:hypothetical protein